MPQASGNAPAEDRPPLAPFEPDDSMFPEEGNFILTPAQDLTPEALKLAGTLNMNALEQGAVIKSGNFGTAQWLQSNGKQAPLVMKTISGQGSFKDLAVEVAAYKAAGDHKNIPKCLGMARIDDQKGMVMEGIAGKDMSGTMEKMRSLYESGKLSQSEFYGTLQYQMGEIVDAIEHLSSRGVVHHDIRPDNIMIEAATGNVKLVDFGIATPTGAAPEAPPAGYGSVAPELHATRQGSRETDMFSAGAAAFLIGEKKDFDYHRTEPLSTEAVFNAMDAYASPIPKSEERRATHKAMPKPRTLQRTTRPHRSLQNTTRRCATRTRFRRRTRSSSMR